MARPAARGLVGAGDMGRAAAVGVMDVAWLEGCPLFDDLRADPRFTAASDVIAARAERVVAAYLVPAVR